MSSGEKKGQPRGKAFERQECNAIMRSMTFLTSNEKMNGVQDKAIPRKPESSRVRNPKPIFVIGFLGFLPLSVDFMPGDHKNHEIYNGSN
jgi:hypothetical protein